MLCERLGGILLGKFSTSLLLERIYNLAYCLLDLINR